MRNAGRRVALAPAWPARGGGGRRRGRRRRRRLYHGGVTGGAAATATADEVVRRRRERESRLQVFRSLMCDLPQTRQSVPPFPSGSAGIKESALGPPLPPVLLRLLTKPYRYSVLYRHSRLTFFPGRERERERGRRVFRLSAFPTFPRKEGKRAKGEGGREGGKKGRGKLCRPREKRESKNLGELFFDRVFLRFVINIPPLFLLQRESCSFFFKFFFPPSPKFLALQRDAQVSTSFPRGEKGTVYSFSFS